MKTAWNFQVIVLDSDYTAHFCYPRQACLSAMYIVHTGSVSIPIIHRSLVNSDSPYSQDRVSIKMQQDSSSCQEQEYACNLDKFHVILVWFPENSWCGGTGVLFTFSWVPLNAAQPTRGVSASRSLQGCFVRGSNCTLTLLPSCLVLINSFILSVVATNANYIASQSRAYHWIFITIKLMSLW